MATGSDAGPVVGRGPAQPEPSTAPGGRIGGSAAMICCAALMETLPKAASEMALRVLAYNLTRVMNIVGAKPLTAAIRA